MLKSLNILMLCTKFDVSGESPWLTNELAEELVGRGYTVVVCYVDWSTKIERAYFKEDRGVRTYVFPKNNYSHLGLLGKAIKWVLGARGAYKAFSKHYNISEFDFLISFSPSSTDRGFVKQAVTKGVKSFHVLWDFFPEHHRQIGLIPAGIAYILARRIELSMLKLHDAIGLMTPRNIQFFDTCWPELQDKNKIIFPIWGKKGSLLRDSQNGSVRAELGIPDEAYVLIYGGQLDAGRGVDTIFKIAKDVYEHNKEVIFLIVGWGRNYELYENMAKSFENIKVIPAMPRPKYKKLLYSCDCGIVLTDTSTTVPTFPSKTFDYFDAKIPILAHVEKHTDYGEIIRDVAKAGLFSEGEDVQEFVKNILTLSSHRSMSIEMGSNGYDYLNKELLVSSAADRVLSWYKDEFEKEKS